MSNIYYVNGDFIEEGQAGIDVRDLSVLRGYGVFDFLRTYGGQPFRLDKNLERLRRSCNLIELDLPYSDDELAHIIYQTLEHNADRADEFNIRIVVTGGISHNNILPDGESSLIVMVTPLQALPAEWYSNGIKVITTPLERSFPRAKTINYIPAIVAQKRARKVGAVEALYVDAEGIVTEGTTTNLFIVRDEQLITPPADENLLNGITRQTIIDMVADDAPVIEQAVTLSALYDADEAFICAANKQIVPVVQVDDTVIGDGRVGNVTRAVMQRFAQLTERRAQGQLI